MRKPDRHRKAKIMEPVSSTSRRGARAAYHEEYPRDRLYCELSFRYQSAPDPVLAPGRERNVGP